jgi:hypothetical protein
VVAPIEGPDGLAAPPSPPLSLCDGVELRVDYQDYTEEEEEEDQEKEDAKNRAARCVTSNDLLVLWETYDEHEGLTRFDRVYPPPCGDTR